jgi:hypothetical protein
MYRPIEERAEPIARRPEQDFLLVRMGLGEPDVEVRLSPDGAGTDDGCGGGYWCPTCRMEIRAEALAWLHELAEAHFGRYSTD